MKVYRKFIFAALATTAMLAGCAKEITPPSFENDKVEAATEGTRVIAVSFAPQTKTELTEGFQPVFVHGDEILVANGEDEPETCVVSVDDKTKIATISTNLAGTLNAVYPAKAARMDEQNPKAIGGVLVYTEQDGTFASANICMAKSIPEDAKEVTFQNKTAVFRIIPAAGKNAQYVEVSAEGFEIANDYEDESAYQSGDVIHVAPITSDTVYVSTRVPEDLTIGHLKFSDGTNEKTITGEQASTPIAAGTLYTVTDKNWESPEADTPEGALAGVFSVSANKKVHFSQGNLWADDSNALHFESNQYSSASSWDASHVSHFTWSSTVEAAVGDSNSGDNLFCDESHKVSVDGGDAIYYALSKDEWSYLFNTRSNASNLYKYGVTVCGKTNCVVLLPDNWEWDETADEHNVGTGWQNGGYPETQTGNEVTWEKMEKAGAVCLPAAGGRGGSIVDSVGGYGYYWSSTAGGSDCACHVRFSSYFVSPDNLGYRDNGYSVRLVTDVSAAPTPTPAAPEYVVMNMGTGDDAYTLKWATKNLGAEKVATDYRCYGDYYQWGSVDKLYSSIAWTDNTTGSFVGLKEGGFAETNLTYKENADLSDATNDVVIKTYPGTGWRMPTSQEFQDLYDACVDDSYNTSKYASEACGESTTITSQGVYWCGNYDGVAGVLFYDGTNRLFFPAAGEGDGTDLGDAGDYGCYWSSTWYSSDIAYYLSFGSSYVYPQYNLYRYYGRSVRPVSD